MGPAPSIGGCDLDCIRVVTGLQEAISRRLDALHPVVVSFGRIEGGRAFNVIADRVSLLGLRCLDGELHERLPGWIEETVKAICASSAPPQVRYRCIAPPVLNDPALTELLERCAIDELGKAQVLQLDQLPSWVPGISPNWSRPFPAACSVLESQGLGLCTASQRSLLPG